MATDTQTSVELSEEQLAAWRAFLRAHSTMLRRISRDLEEADLPPLSWYDVLAALRDAPERSCARSSWPSGCCCRTAA